MNIMYARFHGWRVQTQASVLKLDDPTSIFPSQTKIKGQSNTNIISIFNSMYLSIGNLTCACGVSAFPSQTCPGAGSTTRGTQTE